MHGDRCGRPFGGGARVAGGSQAKKNPTPTLGFIWPKKSGCSRFPDVGPVTAMRACHGARGSHVVLCDRRPCTGSAVVAHSDVAPTETPLTQKRMG